MLSALSSKWSGPWEIIKFFPLALTVIETWWLAQSGQSEVKREAMIDKLRPNLEKGPTAQSMPLAKELAVIDPDEEGTDPIVDPEEIMGRMSYLQCDTSAKDLRLEPAGGVKSVGEEDWGAGAATRLQAWGWLVP